MAIQQLINEVGVVELINDDWHPITRQLYDDLAGAEHRLDYAQTEAYDRVIKALIALVGTASPEPAHFPFTFPYTLS